MEVDSEFTRRLCAALEPFLVESRLICLTDAQLRLFPRKDFKVLAMGAAFGEPVGECKTCHSCGASIGKKGPTEEEILERFTADAELLLLRDKPDDNSSDPRLIHLRVMTERKSGMILYEIEFLVQRW